MIRQLAQSQQLAEARHLCETLLKQNSKDSEALHLMGLIELTEGKLEASATYIRQAITYNDQIIQYHCNLGEALRRAGDYSQAINSFQHALSLKPDYTLARYNIGCTLFAQREFKQAFNELRKALKKSPNDAKIMTACADALRELGKVKEAVAMYQRVLELKPDYAPAHANLGPLLLMKGETEKALTHCQRALFKVQVELAKTLWDDGDADEAVTCYRRAIELRPQNAALHIYLS
jgi:tetratricopeptide (TPR) repeat protein